MIFRGSTRAKADELGISGFVRNEVDGTVYIEIEGNKEAVDEFVAWCRQGPDWAQVESIRVSDGPVKNFKDFFVK